MFSLASEETFKAGQVIFKEGAPGDWVYVILSGRVKISKNIKGRPLTLAVLESGEVFGEMSFLGGIKRTLTAQAIEETTLGLIDRDSLDVEFNKISSDFRFLIVSSERRFQKMLDRVSEFSSRSSPRVQRSISLSYKDRNSFIKSYTGNVSTGGLFVKTDNPLGQGETFLLKLQLPGISDPLKINCEVMWARTKGKGAGAPPPGMGIKFGEMSEKDQGTLKRYIQEMKGV